MIRYTFELAINSYIICILFQGSETNICINGNAVNWSLCNDVYHLFDVNSLKQ